MSDTIAVTSEGVRLVTLETFETLVLSQQPADKPWEPVTDYTLEARREVEGQHPQLIKDVFNPTIAVDAGCGRNGNLVRLLRELKIQAIGFDPEVRDSPFARFLMPGSLMEPCDGPPFADLLICREVLEHLTLVQIRKAVTHLCGYSRQFVYGTTRFSSEHDLLRVETSDDLDPTHITLMSKDLLKLLFILEGFKWRGDLAAQMDWKGYGRTFVFERAV